ncbi:DUF4870 domain-containing protein [Deinococcus sp. SL84]|uniref:DUF4870 domain-containing protein n=1 Tax=Deinococcus sp. SL84 TaxID=2994663 RepID=UPI002275D2EA|nr:DUF4870 domain-containing protein [Deinococcus sp. SL84]MCY1702813.1 DUF4870 domain-containing protein [Deinococcus sp. SL84]
MKRVPPTSEAHPAGVPPASFSTPAAAQLDSLAGAGLSEPDRTPAMLIHLSPLLAFLIPAFGNLLGPLVAWLVYRDRSRTLDDQGKEALNFQISMWIYSTLGVLLLLGLAGLGFLGGAAGAAAGSDALAGLGIFSGIGFIFLLMLGGLFFYVLPIIFMIVAVMSVSDGRPYRYPFTLRILR